MSNVPHFVHRQFQNWASSLIKSGIHAHFRNSHFEQLNSEAAQILTLLRTYNYVIFGLSCFSFALFSSISLLYPADLFGNVLWSLIVTSGLVWQCTLATCITISLAMYFGHSHQDWSGNVLLSHIRTGMAMYFGHSHQEWFGDVLWSLTSKLVWQCTFVSHIRIGLVMYFDHSHQD